MNHSFSYGYYPAAYHIPSYVQWLVRRDFLAPTYAWHRRFLQVLQWRSPRRRWVLKMPGYIDHAEHVLRVYPDARFLHTHRDPLKVIPSMTSFIGAIVWMRSDRVMDVPVFVGMMSAEFDRRFELVRSLQARGLLRRDNYVDVLYSRLVESPLASVEAIYKQLGMQFSEAARERMQAWLAARAQASRRYADHRYDLAQTGLDPETARGRHRAYQEYFDIPSEA